MAVVSPNAVTAKSEDPIAFRIGMPVANKRPGTIKKPPPIPKNRKARYVCRSLGRLWSGALRVDGPVPGRVHQDARHPAEPGHAGRDQPRSDEQRTARNQGEIRSPSRVPTRTRVPAPI